MIRAHRTNKPYLELLDAYGMAGRPRVGWIRLEETYDSAD